MPALDPFSSTMLIEQTSQLPSFDHSTPVLFIKFRVEGSGRAQLGKWSAICTHFALELLLLNWPSLKPQGPISETLQVGSGSACQIGWEPLLNTSKSRLRDAFLPVEHHLVGNILVQEQHQNARNCRSPSIIFLFTQFLDRKLLLLGVSLRIHSLSCVQPRNLLKFRLPTRKRMQTEICT